MLRGTDVAGKFVAAVGRSELRRSGLAAALKRKVEEDNVDDNEEAESYSYYDTMMNIKFY